MKPLKILLGNNTLSLLAGSETWILTLALQLKKMGHIVHGFSPDLGIIAQRLEEKEIPCFQHISTSGVKPFSFVLEDIQKHEYDVIISNHNHIVEYLRKQFPTTPIISTIHGIIHTQNENGKQVRAPEHPALEANVEQFIAVSEEIQSLLQTQYNLDSMIIRNFFDTKLFQVKRPISPSKPKVILINSNYALPHDPEIEVLREVARHYGAKLAATGQNFAMNPDMMKAIEDADIVVGMGRSVLEGVCAGRLGIVHGRWGTGGVICEETIEKLRSVNFSGRDSGGEVWTKEQFIEAIDKYYNEETISWGQEYVRSQHNVVHAADIFVQLSRSLIGAKEETFSNPPMKKLKWNNYATA